MSACGHFNEPDPAGLVLCFNEPDPAGLTPQVCPYLFKGMCREASA